MLSCQRILAGLAFGLSLVLQASQSLAATFTLAVVPQFPAVEVYRTWRPLLDALEAETGHKFELKTSETIPKFEAVFLAAEADFAYMNPYHAVMAKRAHGYVPLVRSSEPLSGILVVRSDSPVRDIQALRATTIAYPAPNAFGASLYMRALLAERFKIPTASVYVQTHVNAYRAVIRGDNPAAGGIRSTLEREPAEVREKLRILYETPETASHPLMAHPRVGKAVQKQVQEALLKIASTESGRKMLAAISLEGLTAASYAKDYAPLESLRLEKFVVSSK